MGKRILSILICCILIIGLIPIAVFAADTQPGTATIVLVNDCDWEDGSGYQMLLDADHNTYGTVIPKAGPLSRDADTPAEVYKEFEYKLPENADGSRKTSNIIAFGKSGTITIPAGTYDFAITNPTDGDSVWIVAEHGDTLGRFDDYVFEANKVYTFTIKMLKDGDGVFLKTTEAKHVYGAWDYNDTEHWHECTNSDCPDKAGSVIDKAAHSGAATCISVAVCEVCGVQYSDTVDPDNHSDLKHIQAKKATKSAEGNIEYWYCEGCGKYYSDEAATTEITKDETVIAKLSNGTKNPQTSDFDNMAFLFILLIVNSSAAIIAVAVIKKKKYSK